MNPSKLIKPKIAIIHRYPPEFELVPCPGWGHIVKNLSLKYNLVHIGMKWGNLPNKEFRKYMKVIEIPLKINLSSGFDKWFKTFLYYLYLPFLVMRVKSEKPKIIMCREIFPFVPSVLSLLNIPVILEITDWWPSLILGHSKFGSKFADFIEKSEVRFWGKREITAIAHTNFETELLINRGFPKEKIRKVGLPMYGGIYRPCNAKKERREFGFDDKDFIVALHGIIHQSKGYDQILRWWAELVKIHPNWKLLFIGGTMGDKWFRELIKELHIEENIILAGWISDQKKLNIYLNTADCLLATRRNTPDTWGNTPSALTHNLMTGKPTVSTNLPGIAETVGNGKYGFLFEPDNYHSFKSVLEYIYENPAKAKKLGRNGLKRVKSYCNSSKISNDYLDVVKQILKF